MKIKFLLALAIIPSNSFSQIPDYVSPTNLVAWLPFSGNTADLSVNSNNGINNGASLTTDRFGNSNSAYVFNGSNSRIDVNLGFDAPQRSISVWLNPSVLLSSVQSVFDNDYPGLNNGHSIVALLPTSNYLLAQAGTNSCSTFPVTTNTWYSMIITRDNSTTKYYINGTLHCSMANATLASASSNGELIRIGCSRLLNRYFNGKIDDVGIWSRALNECEIQQLYTAQSSIDNSVTMNGSTFSASQSGATYQWLNCENANSLILGATSQTFSPSSSGTYSVQISLNGCTTVSECMNIDFASISELDNSTIIIYPNPATDFVNIQLQKNDSGRLVLTDVLGQIVIDQVFTSSDVSLDLKSISSSGAYFLNIYNSDLNLIGAKKIIVK